MDRRLNFSIDETEKVAQEFAVNVASENDLTKPVEDGAALALRQSDFFGFTSASFLNELYNNYVRCWNQAVEDVAFPMLLSPLNLSERILQREKDNLEELEKRLVNHLFQRGKFDLVYSRAHSFADKYVFNVPANIPLDGMNENRDPNEAGEKEDEMNRLEAQAKQVEEEIILLRYKTELLKVENEKAAGLRELVKKLHEEEKAAKNRRTRRRWSNEVEKRVQDL